MPDWEEFINRKDWKEFCEEFGFELHPTEYTAEAMMEYIWQLQSTILGMSSAQKSLAQVFRV